MKTIKYDLIGAYLKGIKIHPQEDVENLGMKVLGFEGCPIADCAFMDVDNLPDVLPDYIQLSNYKIR